MLDKQEGSPSTATRTSQTAQDHPSRRERYEKYLQSPEWAEKRRFVFLRCNWQCEGCLIGQATEVHHRSYKNFGNEFLFELRGLCKTCHDRFHGRGTAL